ncbi:acyltransferase family protein [Pseudooceanicola sp. LIPI14-2-Ac024]|uniref:acyltransferase family protein n=1 Tax=Pseudooceanicola sp. LIPI14-2-Ac024 TaxID=3344875 RepID=UPI0035CF1D6D
MTAGAFRDDIQGMRAIAVAGVVLFHAWPAALPGGFTGVDVFFAISGFLIGGILRRNMAAGRFTLGDFYRRRLRRIVPALVVMVTVTLAVGAAILSPDAFAELGRTAATSAVFVSNVDFYLHSGYFDRAAELRPLLHTWSLSVEEQFYLVFPLALWVVMARARRRLVAVTLGAMLICLAWSQWQAVQAPAAAFFLSPARVFEFLLGALAAYAPPPRRSREALALAGLVMIAAGVWAISAAMPFPGLRALLPAGGAALLLWAGRGPGAGRVARALSLRPLVMLGAISYSVYLWHWPIMAYLRILSPHEPGAAVMAGAVVVSVLVGWLSWRWIEQPFARLAVGRAPVMAMGLGAIAVIAVAGTAVWQRDGMPGRFPAQTLAYFDSGADHSPWRADCHRREGVVQGYAESCVLGGAEAAVVVWGTATGRSWRRPCRTRCRCGRSPGRPVRRCWGWISRGGRCAGVSTTR